jgi:hypothetical protein
MVVIASTAQDLVTPAMPGVQNALEGWVLHQKGVCFIQDERGVFLIDGPVDHR